MTQPYDAILIVAFGGPEKREDVIPFLENVLQGRNVPRERMLEAAEHYYLFDGVSPLNAQVRQVMDSLREELERNEITLPLYWGNRNWHPLLKDAMQQMTADGVKNALALVLSAYSSYSSCRQYLENITRAREAAGSTAPRVDKIRAFYNHPDFIAANVDHLQRAVEQFPEDQRDNIHVAFTAHSIPTAMAQTCDYEKQLTETCRLVAEELELRDDQWSLVYQSRSGRPSDPWLEPDICDHLRELNLQGIGNVVIMPIGFLSDHLEVLYDLDVEARQVCEELGINMVRAASVGTHPRFIAMLCKLIQERLTESPVREAVGNYGPNHDVCPPDCCPAPVRPKR